MKRVFSGLLFILLLTNMLALVFKIEPIKADSSTIYIRADGSIEPTTPQISSSDNVTYALTGNLSSSIVVEKDNITIDGNAYALVGDQILNSRGIDLSERTNVTVTNVGIIAFYCGIFLNSSLNDVVRGNYLINNGWYDHGFGISLISSSNNTISENEVKHDWVTGTAYGITLDHSPNNTLIGNTITNSVFGILLSSSPSNILANNTMNVPILGADFAVVGSSLLEYENYVDSSNTVGGKPIYYWVNRRNMTVPSDAGCVILVNCTCILVQNLNLTGNRPSICLAYTTRCTITRNEVSMATAGIMLYSSSNNVISKNKVSSHWGNSWIGGICLISSDSNVLFGNEIKETMNYTIWYSNGGMWLDSSSHNKIYENIITTYHRGILLNSSADNMIYHNNFINSTQQAYSLNSVNVWDDGYPSGGNCWSDYTGVDLYGGQNQDLPGSDGIGDTPYVIDSNNRDSYPLMQPFTRPVARALILEVPYQYQGDTSWCAPTSLAMALRYYGVTVHSWEIAEFLDLGRGEGAVFGPDLDGQFILTKKLSDYLDSQYPNYRIGYYRTVTSQILNDIRGNLSLGHPVLLALRKSANELGHIITVTGFNGSGIFFNDPSGGAKDLCDKVTWVNSFPAENGYYGFVEDNAISSVICTDYQSGVRFVNTGTLLALSGTQSSTTGALNLYSVPSVGATACCFYIDKPFPFPQVYLDLDKGLTWKSLSFPIGNPIVGNSDILHCRVHIYNHLKTVQTCTVLYTITGYDGITYYLNMEAESLDAQSKGTYTQTVTLGDILTKTQSYHVQLQLMDSQGKGIDTISIPDIYYFTSGTSITLQESQHHLYLHVYDPQGRYVGLNYANNGTEITISDAYYFDDSNGTITIILPTYNSSALAVVDATFSQETIETYNLTIATSNNGQVIDQTSIQETIQKGTQTEYNIEISPSGIIITVPEFSPFLTLPLFMIATLLAVALYKRKQPCSCLKHQ